MNHKNIGGLIYTSGRNGRNGNRGRFSKAGLYLDPGPTFLGKSGNQNGNHAQKVVTETNIPPGGKNKSGNFSVERLKLISTLVIKSGNFSVTEIVPVFYPFKSGGYHFYHFCGYKPCTFHRGNVMELWEI